MSRKTIAFVVAVVGVILAAFQQQFGLHLDPGAVAAGIGAIMAYIFFEAKLDLKALKSQPSKWKDPKFWITVLSGLLAAVEANFQLGIPVETIVTVLTLVVSTLFGVKFKQPAPY